MQLARYTNVAGFLFAQHAYSEKKRWSMLDDNLLTSTFAVGFLFCGVNKVRQLFFCWISIAVDAVACQGTGLF
jgi:hypothetical protein